MTSVDRIQGLSGSQAFKIPCRVATTAPITAYGLQTIDGVVLAAGDRVLRWSETDETLNGIFEVSTSAWPRTLDADGTYDLLDGTLVVVREGTLYAGKIFRISGTNPILPGTSEITAESVADFTMVTAFARTLLDDIDAAAMRGTLGLVIGTNVQAYNANLTTYATTTPTAAGLALLDDANATAQRATLGLVIGTNVQAYDADIPTVAGTQAEWEAGTETALRSGSPANIAQAIAALSVSGGVRGTVVDATNGGANNLTVIDFTGLPSSVKCVRIVFTALSTNGTSTLQIQVGDSGGVETSGYLSSVASSGNTVTAITSGFKLCDPVAASVVSGSLVITALTGTVLEADSRVKIGTTALFYGAGDKTLSATLDRVRITTVNGTDVFDGGQVNIVYW